MPYSNYLSGLYDIQDEYLKVLANVKSEDVTQDINNKLQYIQSSISKIHNKIENTTDENVSKIMNHQNDISSIIEAEKKRLNEKKQTIDNAMYEKKRLITLNESYRLRYAEYTKMLIILVLTLAAFFIIIVLSKIFIFIPVVFFDVLSIIVICIGLFLIVKKYLETLRRDNLYFDKVYLANTNNGNTQKIYVPTTTPVTTLKSSDESKYCETEDCCGEGTKWGLDTITDKYGCIPK
jgi:cation transport ATPase